MNIAFLPPVSAPDGKQGSPCDSGLINFGDVRQVDFPSKYHLPAIGSLAITSFMTRLIDRCSKEFWKSWSDVTQTRQSLHRSGVECLRHSVKKLDDRFPSLKSVIEQ
jgi:hypothetical protein